MTRIIPAIRRVLVLTLIGAAAGVLWARLSKLKPSPTPPVSPPPATDVDERPTKATEPSNRSDEVAQTWVLPNDAGSAPATHLIKTSHRSGIYHVPGGSFYNRIKPERCYPTPEDAEADGYRQAKS